MNYTDIAENRQDDFKPSDIMKKKKKKAKISPSKQQYQDDTMQEVHNMIVGNDSMSMEESKDDGADYMDKNFSERLYAVK